MENEKEYEVPEPEPPDAVEQYEDKLLKQKQEDGQDKIKQPIKYFGYENTWENAGREPPALIVYCRNWGHQTELENNGSCLTKTTYKICNYFYLTDSSD